MSHVFISYSRKDKKYAKKLAEDLRQRGFNVWIDDRIRYGDRWWKTIVRAIKDSTAFVVVMTPDSESSEWVEREILLAQREQKPIFPVLLKGHEFALLITIQYADVRDGRLPEDDFYQRLSNILSPQDTSGAFIASPEQQRKKLSQPIIYGLVLVLIAAVAIVLAAVLTQDNEEGIADKTDEPTVDRLPTRTNVPVSTYTPVVFIQPTPSLATVRTDESGALQVYVPAGCFIMGSQSSNDPMVNLEHEVCISNSFWIDQYEVTNAQYGLIPGDLEDEYKECDFARDSEGNKLEYRIGGDEPDRARNCVNWFEAKAFCEGRGGRLPTEAEWEYAARGPEGYAYPWGNEFEPGRINVLTDEQHKFVEPINAYPRSATWVGAYNMNGGLWEWTSSLYMDYPYNPDDGRENSDTQGRRVLRGGSWDNPPDRATSYYRGKSTPDTHFNSFGFRCVTDVREE